MRRPSVSVIVGAGIMTSVILLRANAGVLFWPGGAINYCSSNVVPIGDNNYSCATRAQDFDFEQGVNRVTADMSARVLQLEGSLKQQREDNNTVLTKLQTAQTAIDNLKCQLAAAKIGGVLCESNPGRQATETIQK